MDLALLERRLAAAVAPHDLLTHPYYLAWNMGELTRGDLRAYAVQYRHQVDALPVLLAQARAQAQDSATVDALDRNLSEELGQIALQVLPDDAALPHRELWLRFAEGMGATREEVLGSEADPSTEAAVEGLHAVVRDGSVEALAALWAYEMQTAKVSRTKREGLVGRYGVTDARTLSFFAAHEALDVLHAADLLSAVARASAASTPAKVEANVRRACDAASRSAKAQWIFLDGAQARRAAVRN